MFSKILVCSDGSEGALTAARMGVQIAQKFGSKALLLHVYDLDVSAYGVWELAIPVEGIATYTEKVRRSLEEHTGRIFRDAGIPYETMLEHGHPVQAITHLAARRQVDLIVIGSRGLSDVPAFLLGSISEEVLHHAHCPVLIVRGDNALQQAPAWQRILLASDGSAGALQATDMALEIAQKFGASLSVLNVLDATSLAYKLSPYVPDDNDNPRLRAEHLLAKITNEVSQKAIALGVSRSFHQETGTPAETIVGYADCHDDDLIVIGCRGLGTFKSLLLGSVSNRVAQHSRRSVLVTR